MRRYVAMEESGTSSSMGNAMCPNMNRLLSLGNSAPSDRFNWAEKSEGGGDSVNPVVGVTLSGVGVREKGVREP